MQLALLPRTLHYNDNQEKGVMAKRNIFQHGVVKLFIFVILLLKFLCTVSDTWLHQHPIARQLLQ
jgi:hypothetical protein